MVKVLSQGACAFAEDTPKVGQAGGAVVLGPAAAVGASKVCMPRKMWNMRCEKVTPGTMRW